MQTQEQHVKLHDAPDPNYLAFQEHFWGLQLLLFPVMLIHRNRYPRPFDLVVSHETN